MFGYVIDEKTKRLAVFLDGEPDKESYPDIDIQDYEVEQDWRGDYYIKGYAPVQSENEKAAAIQAQYTAMVQFILDTEAQKLGYDSCLSVCSYIDTGIAKYDAEGKSFRSWRSEVWNKAFELLDQIKAGSATMPTENELRAILPELVINYNTTGYTI